MSSGLFWRNFNFGQYKCFPHRSAYSTEIQGAKIHFFSDTEPLWDKVLYIYKINNILQGERTPCPIIQVNDFELSYFSICRNRNQRGKENLRRWESIVARSASRNRHRRNKKKRNLRGFLSFCGVDGTRTHYLLIANQMLYQMSYYPGLKKATERVSVALVEYIGVEPMTSCMPCKRSSLLS